MKKVMLMAIGAIALYQAAKRFGVNSFADLRTKVTQLVEDLDLKKWVNVDTLKNMVAPPEEEVLTTA